MLSKEILLNSPLSNFLFRKVSVGCGVGCVVWGVGCGVWGVGCGVGCGVWGVGCGVSLWGVGCGAQFEPNSTNI